MRRVSIFGCGWLGKPLALFLSKQGFNVLGSTTTESKLSVLRDDGITPFLFHADQLDSVDEKELTLFFSSEILVITLPFRRSFDDPWIYQQYIERIIFYATRYGVKHILFTSSTSVYPEANREVSEQDFFEPHNERAKVLQTVEQFLINHENFDATVIRFAGLYGANRLIGKFRAGHKDIPNGSAPVNLIHLDDCVQIMAQIIKQNVWNEIFNACSDEHPTRKDLYTAAAMHSGFEIPTFQDNQDVSFKIVSNKKIKERLEYKFIYPNPIDFNNA